MKHSSKTKIDITTGCTVHAFIQIEEKHDLNINCKAKQKEILIPSRILQIFNDLPGFSRTAVTLTMLQLKLFHTYCFRWITFLVHCNFRCYACSKMFWSFFCFLPVFSRHLSWDCVTSIRIITVFRRRSTRIIPIILWWQNRIINFHRKSNQRKIALNFVLSSSSVPDGAEKAFRCRFNVTIPTVFIVNSSVTYKPRGLIRFTLDL